MSSPLARFFTLRTLGFAGIAIAVALAFTTLNARRTDSTLNPTAPADRTAAPAFSVTTLDGKTWRLGDQQGRVVLINFFATWCPPCRAEMPDLVRIATDYRAKGVETLGLSLDEGGPAVVQPFLDRYSVNYSVAIADAGNPITAGITGIPVTMIIDKTGRIARTYVGMISEERVRADLDQLLGEL